MKGSFHEDYFRDSKDTLRQRTWRERVEPYIADDPVYRVTMYFELYNIIVLNFVLSFKLQPI